MEPLPEPNRPILQRSSVGYLLVLNIGALQNPQAEFEDQEDDEKFLLSEAQAVRLRDVLLAANLPTA